MTEKEARKKAREAGIYWEVLLMFGMNFSGPICTMNLSDKTVDYDESKIDEIINYIRSIDYGR